MIAAEEIANDTSRNWDERIRATAEILFEKRGEKVKRCKMPMCRGVATKSWSLVGLCNQCHRNIEKETNLYYSRKIQADERIFHKRLKSAKGEKVV